MNCSFDPWIRDALAGYGFVGLLVMVLFALIWLGIKTQRRQQRDIVGLTMGKIILMNSWSIGLGCASIAVLWTILTLVKP